MIKNLREPRTEYVPDVVIQEMIRQDCKINVHIKQWEILMEYMGHDADKQWTVRKKLLPRAREINSWFPRIG